MYSTLLYIAKASRRVIQLPLLLRYEEELYSTLLFKVRRGVLQYSALAKARRGVVQYSALSKAKRGVVQYSALLQ